MLGAIDPIRQIAGITSTQNVSATGSPLATGAGADTGFGDMLESAISNVSDLRAQAQESASRFMSGESDDPHKLVLETQRAELSLELFIQVRNKVVQAYQEVMRMQM
jgi:flagellar hook-basal body complex protein FliE